jgi:hypothetical protein
VCDKIQPRERQSSSIVDHQSALACSAITPTISAAHASHRGAPDLGRNETGILARDGGGARAGRPVSAWVLSRFLLTSLSKRAALDRL